MADVHSDIEMQQAKRDDAAAGQNAMREPVKSPEAVQATVPESHEEAHATVENSSQGGGIQGALKGLRQSAIEITPGFVVNNSSNILGALHVGTEVMMLKASTPSTAKAAAKSVNPIVGLGKLVIDTFATSLSGSRPKHTLGDLTKGGIFKGFKNYLTDTKSAAEFEYERVKKPEVSAADYKPGNRWQNRSTLFGLIVWTASAIIPEKKEDPEEVEQMTELQHRNALGYIGERLKQAVDAPHWGQHKRQMIGLGVTLSGICSVLGAWRRRDPLAASEAINGMKYTYKLDKSYLMQSGFSLGSGLALLFSIDDERGFSRFGVGMMGRMMFLPTTIAGKYGWEKQKGAFKWNKIHEGEPGRGLYTASTTSFQLENMAQALIGGAEKNDDGTIVDHEAIHKAAKLKAKIKGAAKKAGESITDEEVQARLQKIQDSREAETSESQPRTRVSSPTHAAMAMPERVAAHHEQALAASGV